MRHKRHSHILVQYEGRVLPVFSTQLGILNNGSIVERTPGGLLYVLQWNNLQHVPTEKFLLAIYLDFLKSGRRELSCHEGAVDHKELLELAKAQLNTFWDKTQ